MLEIDYPTNAAKLVTLVHIRKLEIFGFKSFGFQNTTVEFEPGLVSISGPNGSGKSNILDAIIFTLGENRPKTMRVDKLKSLIHDIDGGTRRGPKMARASVHFDNSDRKIPVDSDSLEITREMDDSGENTYYLNKKKTNRSHVLDLLEVANAGLHQLNAVQQGTVTRISEFSPEEKRQSIENLIGLSYFDEKKGEAVNQLDEADRRLEIALARMDEIKKRIDELEGERNLKLRHDLIEQELNRFNAISSANKMRAIKADKLSKERNLHAITTEIKKYEEQRLVIRKRTHILEEQKSRFMAEVNTYNEAKASIDSELSTAMQSYEEANSGTSTSEKRIEQIQTRIPEIESSIEQVHQVRESLESQVSKLKESLHTINIEKRKIAEDIKSLDSKRAEVLRQQSIASAKKREVDNKIKKLSDKLNDVKLSFSQIKSEIMDDQNKLDSNTAKNDQYNTDAQKLDGYKHKLESIVSNHKTAINELKSRITNLTVNQNKIEKDIEELTLILEKSTKAAARYDAKIRVVKSIMHEDYSIAKLKEEAGRLGIEGLVYEIISWDKQYERPVLAAGSDWIKALVVKDFETLIGLAQTAKAKNLPKLKIIPIEAIPEFSIILPQDKDVIGVLSDYVRCDAKFSALKTFLFGNVILVNSRESAYRISRLGYKAVTTDGQFFEAQASAVIVDINSKISNLTKIISMSTSVEGLIQSIALLKKYTQKKRSSLKKIQDRIQNYKQRLSTSETGLATTNHSYSDLKWKIIATSNMKTQLASRILQLQRKKERLRTESSKQDSHIASLQQRISLIQENFAQPELERIANELSRLNEKKSALESRQTEIMTEHREKTSNVATLISEEIMEKSKTRTLNEEHASLNAEKHQLEVRLRELKIQKQSSNEELVRLREKEQQLISTSGKSVSQLKEFDDQLRNLNEEERSQTKQINALERQTDSINHDLKDLTENEKKIQKILGAFGYDESIETFDVEPLLQALYAEQRSLSVLNAKAPETYTEISTGYRSMSNRKNALEQERNSIVKFIEEIEKDKRQTFLDAFDTVDKEIREIFTTMNGGNAWLELQNEDDIFSSGISYLIQFPKKPKRESTSISGGEKTLAAIVFVLALQKLKPSPFYLFDEVDAHLDAPNSEKLAKIIEQRAQGSQFITVSLKDSIVQKAKLIYGVYPKNGVSQVVTYKDKRLKSIVS